MKFCFRKSTLLVLITLLLLGALLPTFVLAEDTAGQTMAKSSDYEGCGLTSLFTYECAVSMASRLVALWLSLVSWLLYFAGKMMDVSIALSITNGAFRADNVALISVGWPIVRDFASLFIVLAMLVISIATMLRLESYSYKTALPKLILVALLISFSLPVGQLVIDASNVIAIGLYNKMGATARTDVPSGTTIGGVALATPNDVSGVFARGLAISNVYKFDESGELSGPPGATMTGLLISGIMGSIVIMVAAFVLAAFAMLFIARTVMLWMLLVFSPAAFAAHIFPSTAQYAKQWWTMLMSQAFFAPVALFMIYLVAAIIDPSAPGGGFLGKALEHSAGQSGFYSEFTTNVQLIMQYIVLIFLLWYSLTLAQKMGAIGASHAITTGTKWGNSVKGVATRRAQRIAGSAVNGALLNNRVGQALVGNRMSSALGITRAVLSQSNKAKEAREYTAKQEAELLKGLSPREQARMLRAMSSQGALQAFSAMSDDDRNKAAREIHATGAGSLESFSQTLRTAAAADSRNRLSNGQVDPNNKFVSDTMEDFARAALPHNTTVALTAMNPELFGGGVPPLDPAAPGYDPARAQQASSAIATLMNKMKSDQRADVFKNTGAQTDNMGQFMRQYFAQNGSLNDVNKNASTMAVGHQMLQMLMDDHGVDRVGADFEATDYADRRAEQLRGPGAVASASEIEDARRRAYASQFEQIRELKNLSDEIRKSLGGVLFSPTGARVRNPS